MRSKTPEPPDLSEYTKLELIEPITTKLEQLEAKHGQIDSAINNCNNKIESKQVAITENKQAIDTLRQSSGSSSQDLVETKQKLEELLSKVSEVEKTTEQLPSDVKELPARVVKLNEDLTKVKTEAQTNKESNAEALNQVNQELSQVKQQVIDKLPGQVNEIATDLSKALKALATDRDLFNELDKKVGGLETKVNNGGDISELEQKLTQKINQVESKITIDTGGMKFSKNQWRLLLTSVFGTSTDIPESARFGDAKVKLHHVVSKIQETIYGKVYPWEKVGLGVFKASYNGTNGNSYSTLTDNLFIRLKAVEQKYKNTSSSIESRLKAVENKATIDTGGMQVSSKQWGYILDSLFGTKDQIPSRDTLTKTGYSGTYGTRLYDKVDAIIKIIFGTNVVPVYDISLGRFRNQFDPVKNPIGSVSSYGSNPDVDNLDYRLRALENKVG